MSPGCNRPTRRYLIGTPKSELRKWARQIADAQDWHAVRDGVEAKRCAGARRHRDVCPDPLGRAARKGAGHARALRRADRDGAHPAGAAARARPAAAWRAGPSSANSAACSRCNPRAAGATSSTSSQILTIASGLRLVWRARAEWDDWARHSEGCYVLRSNIADWSPEDLWRTYIQLTEAEAAFRIQKSELVDPADLASARGPRQGAYPRLLSRLRAVEDAGAVAAPRRPRAAARGPSSTNSAASRAPTLCSRPTDGRDLRLRCVVRPDRAQAALLDRLGLDLPAAAADPARLRLHRANVVATFAVSPRFPVLDPLELRKLG